jgi:hypothetical protein
MSLRRFNIFSSNASINSRRTTRNARPNLFIDKLFLVYYRVFAEDGAIPSVNHVYSDDPYLGRILAELVAPPHIVVSLKHCLLNVENIDNNTPASLFIAASSPDPNGRCLSSLNPCVSWPGLHTERAVGACCQAF